MFLLRFPTLTVAPKLSTHTHTQSAAPCAQLLCCALLCFAAPALYNPTLAQPLPLHRPAHHPHHQTPHHTLWSFRTLLLNHNNTRHNITFVYIFRHTLSNVTSKCFSTQIHPRLYAELHVVCRVSPLSVSITTNYSSSRSPRFSSRSSEHPF